MLNIEGFGSEAYFVASTTFPAGFLVGTFADDVDAIEFEELETGELIMGLNGDVASFSKPAIINMNVSVLPASLNNEALSVLLQANLVGKDKTSNRDVISCNVLYANKQLISLNNGIIKGGQPGYTISSSGRFSTMTYKFQFGGYSSV